MHCVSDLVSRHTHLPHRVQPGPKRSCDLILVRWAGRRSKFLRAGWSVIFPFSWNWTPDGEPAGNIVIRPEDNGRQHALVYCL